MFEDKIFVIDGFYANIEAIYDFSKVCPLRSFKLDYLEGMESIYGYPSEGALDKVVHLLGASGVVDKTNEQALFGLFRYLLAGDQPDRFSVHTDAQPWAMIIYISPTMDVAGTGIYRHKHTGICDLEKLSDTAREKFLMETLIEDRNDDYAWDCVLSIPFVQNRAVIFKAGDLLHSNVGTWGGDIDSCRITQNFSFQLR